MNLVPVRNLFKEVSVIGVLALAALIVADMPAARAADLETGNSDVALFDQATGRWHLRYRDGSTNSFYYGTPGDVPLLGDWDCDGTATVAMYRPTSGFVYLRNSNQEGVADLEFFYGLASDIPLAGDWDGDGCDTVAIYRNGEVFIRNELSTGVAERSFFFGNPGDRPFAGDFDGDGIDSVGLYRESTGLVYFRNQLDSGVAEFEFFYGAPSDRIVAGDWNGNGSDSVAIFRPSDAQFYFSFENVQQEADVVLRFGDGSWWPVAGDVGAPRGLPDVAYQEIASGFSSPLFLTAPEGDRRMFVVEKAGRIIQIAADGSRSTFFDMSAIVASGGEGGLLGLAFHPAFGENQLFYVHYTEGTDERVERTVVREYRLTEFGPSSTRILLQVDQPATNHNGGMLQFGPYGFLYLGLGDGGGGNDPFGNGQNQNTLLGGIVRIDVASGSSSLWAYGLRNPWRFDFDGDSIYIGDVGQSAWEEVSVGQEGDNFGWPVFEGFQCRLGSACEGLNATPPIRAMANADEGRSVTGGYVYRGSEIPGLQGTFLYSDFVSGYLRGFRLDNGQVVAERDWTSTVGQLASVSSFGEDGFGELYVLSFDGKIRKLVAG
ncbi:MAG: PQQ-dependent sugar dehydrogenase [Acidimicrobiia bacterium]|nr:PQQ-dependent sugar dehydrogenase [Acidimicrobiia bacterium]NNL27278.1 hypothetical protein [Acidimicrobiia bacterium]